MPPACVVDAASAPAAACACGDITVTGCAILRSVGSGRSHQRGGSARDLRVHQPAHREAQIASARFLTARILPCCSPTSPDVPNNRFSLAVPHPDVATSAPALTAGPRDRTIPVYNATIRADGTIAGTSDAGAVMEGRVSGTRMSGQISGPITNSPGPCLSVSLFCFVGERRAHHDGARRFNRRLWRNPGPFWLLSR